MTNTTSATLVFVFVKDKLLSNTTTATLVFGFVEDKLENKLL